MRLKNVENNFWHFNYTKPVCVLTIENLCTFSLSLSPCLNPGRKCVLVKLLLLRMPGTRHPQGTGSVNSKICSARSDLICKIVHGSEVICLTKRSHPSRSVTPETAQDSHILPPNYSNIPLCLHVPQHKDALSSDSAEELPTPHLYLYP